MSKKRTTNAPNPPDPQRDQQHHKARLFFLRGDYFSAREIAETLLETQPTDKRAKNLLRQIEAAERGAGRAASWPDQTRGFKPNWTRRLFYWIRRKWFSNMNWRQNAWLYPIFHWTVETEKPPRAERIIGGIVTLIILGNLLHFLSLGARLGWTYPLASPSRGGFSVSPVWLQASFWGFFLIGISAFMTRGLLHRSGTKPSAQSGP